MTYSPGRKPTVPQLCAGLSTVIDWQQFAQRLPDIRTEHIGIIENDQRGIENQKRAIFQKWLNVYPDAKWSDVYDALVSIDQVVLACSLVRRPMPPPHPPPSPCPGISSKRFKYAISIEDSIGDTLYDLYKTFAQIIHQVKTKFVTFVTQQPAQLQNIIQFTEGAVDPSQSVQFGASNIKEYFDQLDPYYDFLECGVITSIVEQFIGGELAEAMQKHSAKAREFRRAAPIKQLAKHLHKIATFNGLLTIEAKLETPWEKVMIEGLRVLIKYLLPIMPQSQYSLMNNIVILPGCLLLKYGIRDGQKDAIIQHVQHKTQFMRLIGVFRLSVAGEPVILENENPSFSFARSLLDATKTNNKAAVQFLCDISPYINCQDNQGDTVYYTGDGSAYECQPGLCVIISNTAFEDPPADGAKDDRLKWLFENLEFNVIVHHNLTAREMESTVKRYSEMKHTGAFVLVILSDGPSATISYDGNMVAYGVDESCIEIEKLESFFYASVCPSLSELPKIFLIDVHMRRTKSSFITSSPLLHSEKALDAPQPFSIDDPLDFATVYITTMGNTDRGSVFTLALMGATIQADSETPFQKIMQNVKEKLSKDGRQTAEIVNRLSHDYYILRNVRLTKYKEMGLNLTEAIKAWIQIRENTITEINKTADKLEGYHESIKTTRMAGSSTSIIAAGAFAAGIFLSPFTAGTSLALAGVAVGGAATAIGATIAEKFEEKSNLECAQKTLQADYSKLEKITKQLREMKIVVDKAKKQYPSIRELELDDFFAKIFFSHLKVQEGPGRNITQLSVVVDKGLKVEVLYTALSGGIAVAATTIFLGAAAAPVALVPINLFTIVRDIRSNSESKAVQELRKIAAQLTTDKQNILEQLKFFI